MEDLDCTEYFASLAIAETEFEKKSITAGELLEYLDISNVW